MLVVGLLVAFAFGSTLALVAGARRAGSATERFAESSDLAEVLVFVGEDQESATGAADREQGVADMIAVLEADPDVERFERSDTVVITPDPVPPGSFGFTSVGAPGGSVGGAGTPMLLEGRYPNAADEIVVNERAADAFALAVGDRRPLLGLECFECEPAPIDAEVTVTGIVRLASDLVADPSTQGMFLTASSFIDGAWTESARPGTILWIHVAESADPAVVMQRLSTMVSNGDVGNNAAGLGVARRAGHLQENALLIAAAVVGLIGLLVVAQAMSRHASVRRDDEPVLAALGLDRFRRAAAVWCSLVPAVVAGAVGSVVVAYAMSPLFPLGLARRADPDVGLHLDIAVVLGGVAMTLVVGCAILMLVAVRWLGRQRSETDHPSAVVASLASAHVPPVPLTGSRFALERGPRAMRLPVRTTIAVGIVAITAGCAALVVRSSIDGLTGDPARYGQDWDLLAGVEPDRPIAPGPGGSSPEEDAGDRLMSDPRVEAVDLVAQGGVDFTTTDGVEAQVGAMGLSGVGALTELGVLAGRMPVGPGEVALGSQTMSELDVEVGDAVGLAGPCGERDATVVGRAILPLIGGDNPDAGVVLALETFDELCAGQLIADIDENRGVLVRLADGVDAAAFASELEAEGIYAEPGSRPSVLTSLDDIRGVPVIVLTLVSVLGLAAIGYALMLTVRRRGRELAILRALGFRPAQAGRTIVWQALWIAAMSVLVGLPLGIIAGRRIWAAIVENANVIVQVDVPAGLLVALGVAAVVAIVALSLWPAYRAGRLRPAIALRSE